MKSQEYYQDDWLDERGEPTASDDAAKKARLKKRKAAEVRDLVLIASQLYKALKSVEYSNHQCDLFHWPECPQCNQSHNEHAEDCQLAAALAAYEVVR